MRKAIILCNTFWNVNKNSISIGGVETYVYNLSVLLKNNGYEVFIYQLGDNNCQLDYEQLKICIFKFKKKSFFLKSLNQKLYDTAKAKIDDGSIIIVSTDQMSIKTKDYNVISIQHGIAFDIPGSALNSFWRSLSLLQLINKTLRCLKNVKRTEYIKNTVCVDYNFYNWFRTIGTINNRMNICVIPNHTAGFISKELLFNKLAANNNKKKIVFARRFVDYRGTFLFVNVIKRVLIEFPDLDITFAGDGPLKGFIENTFKNDSRVHIVSFQANDSIEFHYQYDIAIVPTIFSEGTSLSLCEAMAAGCFPVASHVGGITNMILDYYNGRLFYPDELNLYNVLKEVLNMDKEAFNRIVNNAYESCFTSFSVSLWEKRWLDFIAHIKK